MVTHVFDNSNLSEESFAIDTWRAVKCSLGHGRKHMLTILPTIWRPDLRHHFSGYCNHCSWKKLNNWLQCRSSLRCCNQSVHVYRNCLEQSQKHVCNCAYDHYNYIWKPGFKDVPLLAILTRSISSKFSAWVLVNIWVQFLTKTACYRPLKNRHFVRVCKEKMMDYQQKENDARNIYLDESLSWTLSN